MPLSPDAIDQKINARCEMLGLTRDRAERFAAIADPTDAHGLLRVLGLDFETLVPLKPRRWLWMAAKTSSVSYKTEISAETLQLALATGCIPAEYECNLLHFLDEASVQLIVMSVEETASSESISPTVIWSNLAKLSHQLGARRREAWA
jgi:hypothetical protein